MNRLELCISSNLKKLPKGLQKNVLFCYTKKICMHKRNKNMNSECLGSRVVSPCFKLVCSFKMIHTKHAMQ